MLIIFSGLPGVGKAVIARELARQVGAVYLRIDSIEQSLRACGAVGESMDDAGYQVAYALAEDNLRLGRTVVADSVNPIALTRDAWIGVANKARVKALEIEVKCSDVREHQRRIEARTQEIPALQPPSWQDVLSREYDPWDRERLVIDSAVSDLEESIRQIRRILPSDAGN